MKFFAYRIATCYECYFLPTLRIRPRPYRMQSGRCYATICWLWFRVGVSFETRPKHQEFPQ